MTRNIRITGVEWNEPTEVQTRAFLDVLIESALNAQDASTDPDQPPETKRPSGRAEGSEQQ